MSDLDHLCDALCHILGNTCRMIRTTRSYEWNVAGRGAELARQCFNEHAMQQSEMVEPIACQILGLGGQPIFDYSDAVLEIDPPTKDDLPPLPEMVSRLSRGHVQAKISIQAAVDVAQACSETATQNLLVAQADMHRFQGYRLALLQAETGEGTTPSERRMTPQRRGKL